MSILQTHHKADGLVLEDIDLCMPLSLPAGLTVPAWIDSRPLCLPTSNQGASEACASFAVAGFAEVQNWKRTHIQTDVDGLELHRKTKATDGISQPGTTFTAVIKTAQDMGILSKTISVQSIKTRRDLQFAIHANDVCLGAFNISDDWNRANTINGWIDRANGVQIGGHAVLICWYDAEGVGFQNSWSGTWGCNGFGRMTWNQFDAQFMYGFALEGD